MPIVIFVSTHDEFAVRAFGGGIERRGEHVASGRKGKIASRLREKSCASRVGLMTLRTKNSLLPRNYVSE